MPRSLATAGLVLRSGGSIANTMFHSAGGGATEHNENVYVSATGAKVAGPVSYLRGSRDRRRGRDRLRQRLAVRHVVDRDLHAGRSSRRSSPPTAAPTSAR